MKLYTLLLNASKEPLKLYKNHFFNNFYFDIFENCFGSPILRNLDISILLFKMQVTPGNFLVIITESTINPLNKKTS